MKLLLFPIFLLASCSSTSSYTQLTEQVAEYGLQKYEGEKADCYIYRDDDTTAMQCLKKDLVK